MSVLGTPTLVSKTFAHSKKPGLFKDMATSEAGAGLCKMSLDHFVVLESKGTTTTKKKAGILQGDHCQLEGVPLAKSGKIWALK